MNEKSKLQQQQNQKEQRIDDQIKAIKAGDKYRHLDHVADWYSEKCTAIRTEERIREFNDNRNHKI